MGNVAVVHSLAQARAALAASGDQAVTVRSAPCAGFFAGPSWFKSLIKQANSAYPAARCDAILDCGDAAGAALAALRSGVKRVAFGGHPAARARLTAIAQALGAALESG